MIVYQNRQDIIDPEVPDTLSMVNNRLQKDEVRLSFEI